MAASKNRKTNQDPHFAPYLRGARTLIKNEEIVTDDGWAFVTSLLSVDGENEVADSDGWLDVSSDYRLTVVLQPDLDGADIAVEARAHPDAPASSVLAQRANQNRGIGDFTTVAFGDLIDADFFTIDDGINAAQPFELDVTGDGVTAGSIRVPLAGTEDADGVRDLIIQTVNDSHLFVTASSGGAATVDVTHDLPGALGALTENVADVGFDFNDFAGGAGSAEILSAENIEHVAQVRFWIRGADAETQKLYAYAQ